MRFGQVWEDVIGYSNSKSDCQMNFKSSSLHFTSDTMLSYASFLPAARTGRGMELSKADTKIRMSY